MLFKTNNYSSLGAIHYVFPDNIIVSMFIFTWGFSQVSWIQIIYIELWNGIGQE